MLVHINGEHILRGGEVALEGNLPEEDVNNIAWLLRFSSFRFHVSSVMTLDV